MELEKMTYSKTKVAEAKKMANSIRISVNRKAEYFGVWSKTLFVYEYCMENINRALFHTDWCGEYREFVELINKMNGSDKPTNKELHDAAKRALRYLKRELGYIEVAMATGEVNVIN